MKFYKICFYRNGRKEPAGTFYRQFDSYGEMKVWANDVLNHDSLYCRYDYKEVSEAIFLQNI